MDELIAFLRAALDDDERVARRLHDGYRRYVCDDGCVEEPDGQWADGSDHLPNHHNTWLLMCDRTERLAEVEAKRRILEIHHRIECQHDHYGPGGDCAECGNDYPCETAYLLAQPYAGRDGWREEWAA